EERRNPCPRTTLHPSAQHLLTHTSFLRLVLPRCQVESGPTVSEPPRWLTPPRLDYPANPLLESCHVHPSNRSDPPARPESGHLLPEVVLPSVCRLCNADERAR